jgi:hypothetical protein
MWISAVRVELSPFGDTSPTFGASCDIGSDRRDVVYLRS